MCNHALSLAGDDDCQSVTLVGYSGSDLPGVLATHPKIQITHMSPYPSSLSKYLPRLANYVLKTLWQSLSLLLSLPWCLGSNMPEVILVQNPPSIPTLPALQFYCRFLCRGRSKLVIDWHNYGYTILAMSQPSGSLLTRFAETIERQFGRGAAANFCVTSAMKKDLAMNWNVADRQITVVYDRPPERFKPIALPEMHETILELGEKYPNFFLDHAGESKFTERNDEDGSISYRQGRPGILVSSTSWTEDEDFSILLDALQLYEEAKSNGDQGASLPHLLCIITGKGPLKEHYQQLIKAKSWHYVSVVMPWVEADVYPKLLGCADLGVCLHASSSDLDLPMKVVDMFGCGIPVAAKKFEALEELVRHNENGLVFEDSEELAQDLIDWFRSGEDKEDVRERLRKEVTKFATLRWKEYWRLTALPVLKEIVQD